MRLKKVVIFLVVVGLGIAGTSTLTFAQKSEKYGGTLIYSNANEFPLNDPHKYKGSAAREMLAPVYSTLFCYTAEGTLANDLAVSLDIIKPNIFRVKIRNDVKFHNGTPLRASDVIYSYNRILDPKTGAMYRGHFEAIESMKAEDNYTILFTLKQPVSPDWFTEVLAQVEAAILSEQWMKAQNRDWTEHMGSGPFMWERFVYGVKAVVKRNPNYYRSDEQGNRLPYLDRIEFVGYTDPALRVVAFRVGDVDCDGFIPWEHLKEFMTYPNVNIDLSMEAFMELTYNVAAPPFNNKLVRKALAYAIDRDKIAQMAFFGFAEPMYGGVLGYMPWSWTYNPASKNRFSYDPKKAKQLLAEAGYPNGFSASILTSQDDQMHIDTSQVIVEELKAIGVNVTIRLEEWGRRVASGNKEDYQLAINGKSPRMLDPDWLATYYHAKVGGFYHRPAKWNFPGMDSNLDKARTLVDKKERMKLYAQWEELYLDECPSIFLVFRQTGGLRSKRIQGFKYFPGVLRTSSTKALESTWIDKSYKRK